ncbi:unnamed protein product [Allacma fusca]|uniref:Uncharacterized protein n=1 Tax=Allacma fusca TaxID=39272 RepID=A0A8J2NYB2_9HEXA|nr:unnamed protein product [Allacma fusca]
MLTKAEARLPLVFLKILCHFRLIPVEINIESGQIKLVDSRKKKTWMCMYCMVVFHCIFLVGRMLQSLALPEYFVFRNVPFHIILIAWMITNCSCAYTGFILWPDITVAIFNELFNEEKSYELTHARGALEFSKYSLQELLAKFSPLMLSDVVICWITVYFVGPDKVFYLYSLLGPFRNNYTYLLCGFVESFLVVTSVAQFTLPFFMLVAFFEKVYSSLRKMSAKLIW